MGTEIERKFLVANDSWRQEVIGTRDIIQGYLANTDKGSIRIRISNDKATLNIKSATPEITRMEFEYSIPGIDATAMLEALCLLPLIEKTRHLVQFDGHTWEIDEFRGENTGLVIAEIELDDLNAGFAKPAWLGKDVSNDPRYYNVYLIEQPYSRWR